MRPALALIVVVLLPALAFAQAKDKDEEKVSNDQPDRPLQMPPASTEVKEALDDFERFSRRNAWERALKALYTISQDQSHRFVDGEKGFIIPVGRKRRQVLSALPPAGQAAYRLFYDSDARKLFDDAKGPTELATLEQIYSAYFSTSIGDNAADRLGDLYFEQGRFDRAADCWLDILRERTDTDLSPALLSVKAALALYQAQRRSEFEQIRADLRERYPGEKLTLGGQTAAAPALLERLLKDAAPVAPGGDAPSAGMADPGLALADRVEPVWQMRFGESVEAGMTPPELTQWESNALSAAVPAVAVIDGSRLFANYLSYLFAIDLKSGKLLWRSAAFHHVEIPAMQQVAQLTDVTRYTILASGEHVWSLSRDLKDGNFQAPFVLTCWRSENGEAIWHSKDLSDYAGLDLNGPPILAAGKIFLPATGPGSPQQGHGGMQQLVLAIQPHDGKVIWKSEVGALRQDNRNRWWYGNREPEAQPRLVYHAGAIYVETHQGVFARLDADSGAVDWGFAYQTDPVQGQSRFFFFWGERMQPQEPTPEGSLPLLTGETFLLKGLQSTRLNALDPNRMKVLWDRPISKNSRLLAADEKTLYLGGAEISAIDLQSRSLLWATRVPGGCATARVLVRKDAIWQSTPRGIIELDPRTGTVRRFFRGRDLGSVGGDLVLTGPLLVSVSNRSITAYPRTAGAPRDVTTARSAAASRTTSTTRVTNE
jgi:outer membrane protein assembly factor BamB/tetratricopeptide (TPR) repeat protein